MSQYKGQGPDFAEVMPTRPIVINGKTFNPEKCVHDWDPDNPINPGIEHTCVHDWRVFWGNQPKAQ